MGDTPLTTLHIAVLRATLDGPMPDRDPDALAKAMRDLIAHDLVAGTQTPTDAGIAALDMVDATNAQWRERLEGKWIAPAPEWTGPDYLIGRHWIGGIRKRPAGGWLGIIRGTDLIFPTDAKARAWVEVEVIKALGAEVVG
jgi:hypothetical protein